MGGTALKVETKRLNKDEYFALQDEVIKIF